jgi:hypothetical protein
MSRSLFTPASVESNVAEGDIFRNDILGPAAFFAGLTSMQFNAPGQAASVATVAIAFVLVWGYSKAPLYKAAHDRFYAKYGRIKGWLLPFARNPVLLVGLGFLWAVALGYVTPENLSWFSLARLLGLK